MRPICSCCEPSVAEMVSELTTAKLSGRAPYLSWSARVFERLLCEGAGDARLAVEDDAVHLRGREHVAVEHERELVERRLGAVEALADLAEGLRALVVEVEVDGPAPGGLLEAEGRIVDGRSVELDGSEDVLDEPVGSQVISG